MAPESRWEIAGGLMAHGEDAGDHNLPTLLWLGIEPLVGASPARALEAASASRIPAIARFSARRAVDAGALDALVAALAAAAAKEPAAQVSLLEGMRDGLDGRFDVTPPRGWAPLYGRLKRADAPVGRLAQEIAQRFGDAEAAARNFATLRSRSAPVEERRQALQVLAAQRRAPLVAALPAALDDPATRVEAIRAIAAFDDDGLGKGLIGRYAGLSGGEKSEAIQTLASRRRYGLMLTAAIAGNVVPRRDVPAHIARQLRRVVGTGFTEVWGPVEQIASEERAFARYRGLLTERALGGADAAKGQEVFARTCASCHKMYGDGGTIGPDITGSNRGNLEYLLSNVVTPNADVPDAYRMVHVTTRDGRSFAGNVAAETERQLTLRVVGQEKTVLSKADIQSREQTAVSLMPPGLLDGLTDREVLDLVAFLRTAGPVKPQAGRTP